MNWRTATIVASVLAASLLVPNMVGPAFAASSTPALTFTSKGNEWWVESPIGGTDAGKIAKVESRDSYGPYVTLTKRSWGAWAGSYHVEPGHLVKYRVTLQDGRIGYSCAFAHPSGTSKCGAPVPPANATPTPTPTPTPAPAPAPAPPAYPWHTGIVSTTFWVGELYDATLADGSQVCSTYDSNWAYHWSGVNKGKLPAGTPGCAGSIFGGCDGIVGADNVCRTERRTAANGYFPTAVTPLENPFYLDLPYDDVNDDVGFQERCSVIPWADQAPYAGKCKDRAFSFMKDRWVRIVGPNGRTCYGQIEDAGPSHGTLYHDKTYVFGKTDARPAQTRFNNAGMDVSPALNGCLGFASLDGDSDRVSWQFVDDADVPEGPWKRIVTKRQVSQ